MTIEQAFELGLDTPPHRHPDMVALEARQANMEGAGLVSVADLVRRALRMNADRVIVGEVLGDEVLPMLNAMSQGRSGSMCTIHADSSAGVFRRIASYAVQAPERLPLEASNLLLAGAIHFVVHLDSDVHDSPNQVRSHDQGWPLDQRPARKSMSRHGSDSSISRLGRPGPGSSRPSGRWWMPTGCRSSPTRSTGLVPTADAGGFAAAARDTPRNWPCSGTSRPVRPSLAF